MKLHSGLITKGIGTSSSRWEELTIRSIVIVKYGQGSYYFDSRSVHWHEDHRMLFVARCVFIASLSHQNHNLAVRVWPTPVISRRNCIKFILDLRPAPVIHHFRPLMTYSSPSRFASQLMLVASDEAYIRVLIWCYIIGKSATYYCGFSHAKTRADLTAQKRLEPLFLLFSITVVF